MYQIYAASTARNMIPFPICLCAIFPKPIINRESFVIIFPFATAFVTVYGVENSLFFPFSFQPFSRYGPPLNLNVETSRMPVRAPWDFYQKKSFYCAMSVFIVVFISSVFSAALSAVISPATSALPMFSAGDQ